MVRSTQILSPVAQAVLVYFEDLLTQLGLGIIAPQDMSTKINGRYGTLNSEDLEAFRQEWTTRHPIYPKGEIVGEALKELMGNQELSQDAAKTALREAAIRHSPEMLQFFEDGLVEYLQNRKPKN